MSKSIESLFLDLIDQTEICNPGKENYFDLKDFLEVDENQFEAIVFSLIESGKIIERKPRRFELL